MHPYTKELLDHCSDFSKNLLIETKDMYPFGAFISSSGQLHPLEMEFKKGIKNEIVINALHTYLTSEYKEGNILAYATVYEVDFQLSEQDSPQSAFAVDIESKYSDVPIYYFPFVINDEEVSFQAPFAVAR